MGRTGYGLGVGVVTRRSNWVKKWALALESTKVPAIGAVNADLPFWLLSNVFCIIVGG
jgi:hypothetical protein